MEIKLLQLTSAIVSAYISKNPIQTKDIPILIQSTHQALSDTNTAEPADLQPIDGPAVPVNSSVTRDFIICLYDGLKFKALKKHIRSAHKISPEEYRRTWHLPPDYPMVAPNYAARRSVIAKEMGLGQEMVEPDTKPPRKMKPSDT